VSLFGNVVTNATGHGHIVIHGLTSSELGALEVIKNADGKCI
jgi:hypothetical protein